jgi:putative spermidine/putrescine transport system substrate-binding protein
MGSLIIALSLILAACAAAPTPTPTPAVEVPTVWDQLEAKAKTQGEINLYTFKYKQYFIEAAKGFEAKYGIKVNVVEGSGEATLQKVMAEKGTQGTVDVWVPSGPQVQPAVEGGLLYGPIDKILPNATNLDPFDAKYAEGFPHQGYVVPAWRNQAVLAYDSRFVATPPATLAELEAWIKANPKKFTYNDPAKGGAGQAFVQAVIYWKTGSADKYLGTFDQSIIDKEWPAVWNWLRSIGPNVTYAANNNDALDKLNRGEAWIAAAWEDMVVLWVSQGQLPKSIKMYLLRDGYPGGGDFVGVPASSTKKAAALLFINHLLTKEVQETLPRLAGMRPVRTDVPLPADLAGGMLSAEELKYRVPWPLPGYKNYYKQNWLKEVGG